MDRLPNRNASQEVVVSQQNKTTQTPTKEQRPPSPTPALPEATLPTDRGTSSNAFASGANQNSGNVITDRPSTRVHAPPGGRSQISFGDDTAATQTQPSVASTATPGESQNSELTASAKNFAKQQMSSSIFADASSKPKAAAAAAAFASKSVTRKATSSNAFASGANQNSGNVITDRPSTRVHAPPGGRSQISLGGYGTTSTKSKPRTAVAKPPPNVQAAAATKTAQRFAQKQLASSVFGSAKPKTTSRRVNRVPPGGRSNIIFG